MNGYDPALSHFDLDMKRGAQAELFVQDVCEALSQRSSPIEVKSDAWFVHSQRFYVEIECRGRDGTWRPSGLATTKSNLWSIKWGKHPGCFIVETEWMRRAATLAGQDTRNKSSCDYGQNPTRGVFVYLNHLIQTRDKALDERE